VVYEALTPPCVDSNLKAATHPSTAARGWRLMAFAWEVGKRDQTRRAILAFPLWLYDAGWSINPLLRPLSIYNRFAPNLLRALLLRTVPILVPSWC
jgi:hypothetical protein